MSSLVEHPAAPLPELRLNVRTLQDNVDQMAAWTREQDVELAPHIKTTMTRPIVERQLAAGAWGVTVATARQAAIALDWQVERIVIANEVVHRGDLTLLRRMLDASPGLELYCFVDSAEGLDRARSVLAGIPNPLRVLVDVGVAEGRTGVRDPASAYALGRAVAQSESGVLLAGVGAYEGIRPNRRDAANLADIDAHCRQAVETFKALAPLVNTDQAVFTMGGSAFPDRAIAAYSESRIDGSVFVLRSGCYVTHDHGMYAEISPLPWLKPALIVRAVVLTAPEAERAIVGAGKRELPYDAGLPVLLSARDSHGNVIPEARGTASAIFDHHLILTDAYDLQVGDEVDLGISHPCSAFDKWPDITVVDENGDVQETWHPQFR